MGARTIIAASSLALTCTARGTYYTGFERPQFLGSATGTILTGVQGWTAAAQGMNFHVNTYGGNAPAFVQNPVGGNQFIAGTSGTGPARGQVGIAFTNNTWTVSYDMNAAFHGTLPAAANLGNFSLNHETLSAGLFQQFLNYVNFNVPTNPAAGWRSVFNVFDEGGAALNSQSPGSFWADLKHNNWYRSYVTVDFSAHRILQVGILDLHTGLGASAAPQGWYLTGGANSTLPLPNAIRLFTGGNAGNTTGWDNIQAIPGPAGAIALAAGGLLVTARRRRLGARGLSETEA